MEIDIKNNFRIQNYKPQIDFFLDVHLCKYEVDKHVALAELPPYPRIRCDVLSLLRGREDGSFWSVCYFFFFSYFIQLYPYALIRRYRLVGSDYTSYI